MLQRVFCSLLIFFGNVLALQAAPFVKYTVRNAIERHAVCNDGSPAVYYFRAGSQKSDTWIIFLGGGGFCYSVASCNQRKIHSPELMTSIGYPETIKLDGILSDSAIDNPDFYNAHEIVIPYCSSDLWSGSKGKSVATGGYEFRGRKILRAIVRDLQAQKRAESLTNAPRVLLAGTSAGGVGVMVHLDWLASRLPDSSVRGFNDAGWTPDFQGLPDTVTGRSQSAVRFWNGKPDASCASANETATYHCYTSSVYPFLKSSLMVQMSQHDSVFLDSLGVDPPLNPKEKVLATLFAAAVRASLDPVAAAFSPRTFTHGLLPSKRFMSLKVNGYSVQQVLGNWFFNRAGSVKVIR